MGAGDVLLGEMLDQLFFDGFRGFGGIADESEPVRHAEHVCVNGHGRLPNASTTLAVFRPTPGRLVSPSIVSGTSPPKSWTTFCAIATKCWALLFG